MKPMHTLLAVLAASAALAVAAAADDPTPPTQQQESPIMTIDDILTESGAFFLATVDGDQPKLRPLGAHHVVDGVLWFGVGEFKNVYRQLAANPKCEFVALRPNNGGWLRYTGRAVFAEGAEREALEELFLESMPALRGIYDKQPGHRMMCFRLADARAELIPMMPPGQLLLDATAALDEDGVCENVDDLAISFEATHAMVFPDNTEHFTCTTTVKPLSPPSAEQP